MISTITKLAFVVALVSLSAVTGCQRFGLDESESMDGSASEDPQDGVDTKIDGYHEEGGFWGDATESDGIDPEIKTRPGA